MKEQRKEKDGAFWSLMKSHSLFHSITDILLLCLFWCVLVHGKVSRGTVILGVSFFLAVRVVNAENCERV